MKRTQIPDDYAVTDRILLLAEAKGWPDPHLELEQFVLHHQAKGNVMIDWDKAFMKWLANQKRWGLEHGRPVKPYKIPVKQGEFVLRARPVVPELTPEEIAANRRRVGPLLRDLVRQFDARKAGEK